MEVDQNSIKGLLVLVGPEFLGLEIRKIGIAIFTKEKIILLADFSLDDISSFFLVELLKFENKGEQAIEYLLI